jgi:transposase
MPPRHDPAKKAEARRLREQNFTLAQISKRLGVGVKIIDGWTKDIYQRQQQLKRESAQRMARQGWLATEIAREIDVSAATVLFSL